MLKTKKKMKKIKKKQNPCQQWWGSSYNREE